MAHDFNAASFALRTQMRLQGHQISLGHAQQLLAAALGYKSLASMQHSLQRRPVLQLAQIVVIDGLCLTTRCDSLKLLHAAVAINKTIVSVLRSAPDAPLVLQGWDDFLDDYLVPTIAAECLDTEGVYRATAETNADFDEAEIEIAGHSRPATQTSLLPESIAISPCGQFLVIPFVGTLIGDQHEDRSYSGHVIDIHGTAKLELVDRRCLLKNIELNVGARVQEQAFSMD